MTFGSLFSGIGGLDLGLERAGMKPMWQVEIDEYCRKVLAKHWPNVQRWDDVTTFDPTIYGKPDCIAGGFPCQDLSVAGRRAGLGGERSGLWREFARIVRLVRPRYVIVENVPGLLVPGDGWPAAIGRVLRDLAACGYDAEWTSLPAWAFGSTQARWRVFIVAYAQGQRRRKRVFAIGDQTKIAESRSSNRDDANAKRGIGGQRAKEGSDEERERWPPSQPSGRDSQFIGSGWWSAEPDLVRMVYGVPRRLVRDRIKGLGNCVIPQVAEFVGRCVMRHAKGN